MKRHALLAIAALISPAFADDAFAQEAAPATPPAPPAETPAPPAETPPGVPPAELPPPGVVEPPAVPIDERVASLEGKVDGLAEQTSVMDATLQALAKIKMSGYIQGRYEQFEDADFGLNPTNGRPRGTNRFRVRRARLKTTYTGTNGEYLLQIDAIGGNPVTNGADGVTLKDAEATLIDTWTPLGMRLTLGQFKWPFGYEVLQSSSDREMPERARIVTTLFPGERDRGLRLTGRYEWFRFATALVNGGLGTTDTLYTTFDTTSWKDFVGRIGADFGFIVGGLSWYWGHTLNTVAARTGSQLIVDTNGDGVIQANEVTTVMATPAAYTRFSRTRLGADVQFYQDIPGLGGFALKSEFMYSKDSAISFNNIPGNPCNDFTQWGFYVNATQNIGDYIGATVRFDQYDSSNGSSECMSATMMGTRSNKAINTLGGALSIYFSANLKGTLAYQHSFDLSIDNFVSQLQAKF